jgi:hypothetical protein
MTKFGKAEKTRLSGLGNRSIRFWRINNKIKEEAKLEALKIQQFLKHGKGNERHQGANPCVNNRI